MFSNTSLLLLTHSLDVKSLPGQLDNHIKKNEVRPLLLLCCGGASVVSDSVRPHRWKPTRLPCPWGSQGKNTRVACHFLLQCMKWKVKVKSLSRVRLCATPWTAAYQVPPSMGFSRQEYWSGVPLPSPDPYLTPNIKINSKWIKDLNLRDKTTRVLKQNVGLNLCDVDLVNNFLDMTTKA